MLFQKVDRRQFCLHRMPYSQFLYNVRHFECAQIICILVHKFNFYVVCSLKYTFTVSGFGMTALILIWLLAQ